MVEEDELREIRERLENLHEAMLGLESADPDYESESDEDEEHDYGDEDY